MVHRASSIGALPSLHGLCRLRIDLRFIGERLGGLSPGTSGSC